MKFLSRLLIPLGVVLAALGAAGFHDPAGVLERGEERLAGEAAETAERLQHLLAEMAEAAGETAPPQEEAAAWLQGLGWAPREGEDEAARLLRLRATLAGGLSEDRIRELAGHYDLARGQARRLERLERELARVREARAAGDEESPGREPGAASLFAAGLLLLAAGGFLARQQRLQPGVSVSGRAAGELSDLRSRLQQAREALQALEEEAAALPAGLLRERLDEIQKGPFLEISDASEDWMLRLGFAAYARIWDGFASAERLTARAWSMATDGFPGEAFRELPRARAALERSLAALAEVEAGIRG